VLTILVVLAQSAALPDAGAGDPSVELLYARGVEEALEKLGRNRRIDAVLLAAGRETEAIESAIGDDEPAPPTLFRPDPGETKEAALARVVAAIEG